ncbi:MAG: chemotaxis protein CheA [Oligoflexia bacterium]|nr:chemotaxis protein CheA [Oligoflexia bacterium]
MNQAPGVEIDPSVLLGFLEESREMLGSLDALFVQLEKDPYNTDLVNAVFRPIHSIKGNAPFFGLMRLKTIAHDFESLLAALRAKKIEASQSLFDLLLAGIDELKAMLERIASAQPEVVDEAKFSDLIQRAKAAASGAAGGGERAQASEWETLEKLAQAISGWKLEAPKQELLEELISVIARNRKTSPPAAAVANEPLKTPEPVSEVARPQASAVRMDSGKSMRVPEERIDTFLRFVGELIVAQDMLRHFSSQIEASVVPTGLKRDLATIISVINSLGAGLASAIMSIRQVPVRSLLQKAPRLIRDIAAAKGKEIEVVLAGEEIEIDKSLIEILDAPITHMARNAADHGIELPEVRLAAGKNRKGTVTITCQEGAKDLIVTVADDGAGLNLAALKRKAEGLGMIAGGDTLTEAQIVDLIFMAGVSTAKEVSDVSGRGVGMDVVKRNIETAGGSISVINNAGQGAQFILRLPKSVTTQIIDGFVVDICGVNYVLPQEKVLETWYFGKSDIIDVVERGSCISRHDTVMPILDLVSLLGSTRQSSTSDLPRSAVTVDVDRTQLALCVDDVIGPRQLVLKPLAEFVNGQKLFLGAALLGDGQIALVLDVGKLSAHRSQMCDGATLH